jgi:hypothetical protein
MAVENGDRPSYPGSYFEGTVPAVVAASKLRAQKHAADEANRRRGQRGDSTASVSQISQALRHVSEAPSLPPRRVYFVDENGRISPYQEPTPREIRIARQLEAARARKLERQALRFR